ncbi:hypothetical protein BH09MYX1_BH09MYX1_37750 [soil metagenome]
MTTRLVADPSRPYQLEGNLLFIWRPRGRGRDDRAEGLLASIRTCSNPSCACTDAKVAAMVVDDRVRWAKQSPRGLDLSWRQDHESDEVRTRSVVHQLTLDMLTGQVVDARGGEAPTAVQPFFRALIPSWVLDDIYAVWARTRPRLEETWSEQALRHWRPGTMLPALTAYPDARPDAFVRDGKTYIVDFTFCVEPDCSCRDNRFVVLVVDNSTPTRPIWTQIAAAELDDELTMRRFDVEDEHMNTLARLYLDWRERSGNPRKRFEEIRTRVRERGAELRAMYDARERAAATLARPTPTALSALERLLSSAKAKPGRNEPCPCGSGRKYKRCCAR